MLSSIVRRTNQALTSGGLWSGGLATVQKNILQTMRARTKETYS